MSELGELYASMTLKTLALSMISIFVPIYLYDIGFSLVEISLYLFTYFVFRLPFNIVAGVLVAKYGPKHVLSYGYVLSLVYLGLLLTLPEYGWSLWVVALVAAISTSFFFVAYHVDFSKIKQSKEEGAELGHMYVLVRVAGAVGPLFGGLLATVFGTDTAMIAAILIMLLAIIPLMMTAEPVRATGKMPDFSTVKLNKETRNILAYSGAAIARQSMLYLWPLYIALFVFTENIYGMVGFVTSISVVSSIIAAKMFGGLIDDRKGGNLLNYGAIFYSIINALRVTVSTTHGVIGINIMSEVGETSMVLPLTKGFYDHADSRKDRVAYISLMEVATGFPRALFWLVIAAMFANFEPEFVLKAGMLFAALVTPLVMVQNFSAIKPYKA